MRPDTAVKVLSRLLIVMGGLAALALVPMVMPTAWMIPVNDWIGLGPFPDVPLTGYLARSASALYAMFGVLLLYVGANAGRYLDLIRVIGWLTVAFGVALTVIDFGVGMPASWSWGEGPPTVLIGAAFVWLVGRARPASGS